ncbi:D11 protein [Serratia phage Slocum]|nr:D11 protein [Serratia phage Slocum]
MAKSWGSTKGSTTSDKIDYMKFKNGKQTVRVVSGVEARYVYWPKNKDDKTAPFDCLRFDRDNERFIQGAKDPVQDLGLIDPKTKEPLKCKKNYVCWVIDRADNKLKVMQVKDGILKGIQSTMSQLEIEDPSMIDITIVRTGSSWNDTEYSVEPITAMKFLGAVTKEGTPEYNLHQADKELLGEDMEKVKDLRELFPIQSYDEQRTALEGFMEGRQDKKEGGTDNEAAATANDAEAASDLDD